MNVLRGRKREIYRGDTLANLAFVALAQCKHRHYSTLATYLSLELSVVHLGCVSAAGMDEGSVWDPHAYLIFRIETVLCICLGSQLETGNWWYFLSWQRLGTWHWAQLLQERNILLSSVAVPLANDPNQIFWPQRELCLLNQNKGYTVGSLSLSQ